MSGRERKGEADNFEGANFESRVPDEIVLKIEEYTFFTFFFPISSVSYILSLKEIMGLQLSYACPSLF